MRRVIEEEDESLHIPTFNAMSFQDTEQSMFTNIKA